MKERVVLDDVAKALGVSKTTVSRALSGTGRISSETRERILAYVQEIGYIPNASASNLSMSRTRNIAYSMPLRDTSPYFLDCLHGVCREASATGYDVIVVDDSMDAMSHILGSRKVDALVLSSFVHGDDALRKLAGYHLPLVLTGSTAVPGVIQVGYDARSAFRQLTSYLMDAWHTDLGLILTGKYPANLCRANGFCDAMTVRGKMTPHIFWDVYDSARSVQILLSLYREGIYGVICGDDPICTDLLSALSVLRNEDDAELRQMASTMKLASFHTNRFLKQFHPEIPTVVMEPTHLGEFAARLAIHEIEEGSTPPSTLLEYSLHLPDQQA